MPAHDVPIRETSGAGLAEETRPLRSDAERNRKRILEAARDVFAERGVAATLDDVAHRAGVGVGTVYRRFPTKETLAEAVFVDRLEELVALAERSLGAPSGWEGLTSFLRTVADMQAADRGLRDVVLGSGFGTRHFAEVGERMVPLIERLFARAQAEGKLRADASVNDMPIVMMLVSEVAHHSAGVRPDVHRRYLELLIDGLRANPANTRLGDPLTREELEEISHQWMPTLDARRPTEKGC